MATRQVYATSGAAQAPLDSIRCSRGRERVSAGRDARQASG